MTWLVGLALAADPSALRQMSGDGPLLEVSNEALGVAGHLGELRISASYAYGANIAVHAGRQWPLLGAEKRWGVDGLAAVGLVGLLATPGAALSVTGEVRAGARGERGQATIGLLAPVAVRLGTPLDLALPVALEGRLVTALGPLWVGTRGQMGATFAPGGAPAVRFLGGVFVELKP